MQRSAIVSDDQLYRYRLERDLGRSGKVAACIMVNPSTADGVADDHTIRKWLGFASRLGIGRIIVGNKFAWRATDITALSVAADPVGPENDKHLEQIMRDADLHIVAWGRLNKLPAGLRSRWLAVVGIAERVGCSLFCLKTLKDGHPRHPLTLAYETPLVPWRLPK